MYSLLALQLSYAKGKLFVLCKLSDTKRFPFCFLTRHNLTGCVLLLCQLVNVLIVLTRIWCVCNLCSLFVGLLFTFLLLKNFKGWLFDQIKNLVIKHQYLNLYNITFSTVTRRVEIKLFLTSHEKDPIILTTTVKIITCLVDNQIYLVYVFCSLVFNLLQTVLCFCSSFIECSQWLHGIF